MMPHTSSSPSWIVWLNEDSRIASFHPVEGYREQGFRDHDHFLAFVQNLQEQGYRFQ